MILKKNLSEDWNAVVDVIRPVAAVPVGFGCPLVGCMVALIGSAALRATSIDPQTLTFY